VPDGEADRERLRLVGMKTDRRNVVVAAFALTLISGVCGKKQRNWWPQNGGWFRCWPPSWSGIGSSTSRRFWYAQG
jgi:hypothetical protein